METLGYSVVLQPRAVRQTVPHQRLVLPPAYPILAWASLLGETEDAINRTAAAGSNQLTSCDGDQILSPRGNALDEFHSPTYRRGLEGGLAGPSQSVFGKLFDSLRQTTGAVASDARNVFCRGYLRVSLPLLGGPRVTCVR